MFAVVKPRDGICFHCELTRITWKHGVSFLDNDETKVVDIQHVGDAESCITVIGAMVETIIVDTPATKSAPASTSTSNDSLTSKLWRRIEGTSPSIPTDAESCITVIGALVETKIVDAPATKSATSSTPASNQWRRIEGKSSPSSSLSSSEEEWWPAPPTILKLQKRSSQNIIYKTAAAAAAAGISGGKRATQNVKDTTSSSSLSSDEESSPAPQIVRKSRKQSSLNTTIKTAATTAAGSSGKQATRQVKGSSDFVDFSSNDEELYDILLRSSDSDEPNKSTSSELEIPHTPPPQRSSNEGDDGDGDEPPKSTSSELEVPLTHPPQRSRNEGDDGDGDEPPKSTSSELEVPPTHPPQCSRNEGDDEEVEQPAEEVTGEMSKSDKRRQNKTYFCIFCKKRTTHFARHLTNIHSEKEEVLEIVKHGLGTRERAKLISKIRGQGAIEYNNTMATTREGTGSGSVQLGRMMAGVSIDTDLYLPCLECGNYYKKRNLQQHYKRCANKAGPSNLLSKCRVRKLGHKIPSHVKVTMSEQLKEILGSMSASPDIMRLIESDPVIVAYGNKLCKTHKHIISTQVNSIRRHLRVLAVITTSMYEHDAGDPDKQLSVSYYYKHEKFELFKRAVLNHMGYKDGDNTKYESASQASAIGRIWLNCAKSLNDLYLDLGLREDKTQLDEWLQKYKSQYYVEVEKPASVQLTRNRWNTKMTTPNDREVATLCSHLAKVMRHHKSKLSEKFDNTHWAELSKALLVYLTVFNRKRSGEVQGAHLKQYQERVTYKDLADNWPDHLCSNDIQQLKQHSRFLVKGKRSKGVSILMNEGDVKCMELLIAHRENAEVTKDNVFLFAKANTHFDCRSALREFAKVCGVKRPNLLTTTKVRKHFASSIPMLNLAGSDMMTVAQFLGHDEKTEALHYRMPDAIEEMARITTLLYASTTMRMHELKDRNLRTINHETPGPAHDAALSPDEPTTAHVDHSSLSPDIVLTERNCSREPSAHLLRRHRRRLCSTDSSHSKEDETDEKDKEDAIRMKTNRRGLHKHRICSSPESSSPPPPPPPRSSTSVSTTSEKTKTTPNKRGEESRRSTIVSREPQPSTSVARVDSPVERERSFPIATDDSSSSDDRFTRGQRRQPQQRLVLSPSPERYPTISPPPTARINRLVLSPDSPTTFPATFPTTSTDEDNDNGDNEPPIVNTSRTTTTFEPPASTSAACDATDDICDGVSGSTPPRKLVRKRLPWTPRQTRVIEDNFKTYMDTKRIPPTHLISKVLSENGQALHARTVESIRSHISNINTGKTSRAKKLKRLNM